MKRKNPPVSKHSYLCSEHFSEECFKRRMGGRAYLKPGSVPTRFSFTPKAKPKRKAPVDRSSPVGANQLKAQPDAVEISPEEAVIFPSQQSELPSVTAAKTEVLKSNEELLMDPLEAKKDEVRRLNELLETQRKELEDELTKKMRQLEQERELRKELENMFQKSLFNINSIKGNPKLFKFYTGFPNYEIFSMVLSFLGREAASQLVYSNSEQKDAQKKEKAGPKRTLSMEE